MVPAKDSTALLLPRADMVDPENVKVELEMAPSTRRAAAFAAATLMVVEITSYVS
jgi:hypothetical protein